MHLVGRQPAQCLGDRLIADLGRLSQRFLDRCTRLGFESDAEKLRGQAANFVLAIWKSETGKKPEAAKVAQVVESAQVDGRLSFRRVVQVLAVALAQEASK